MSWFADEIVLLLMPLGKSAYFACLLILRPLRRENDYTQWPQKDKRKNRKEQGMPILKTKGTLILYPKPFIVALTH